MEDEAEGVALALVRHFSHIARTTMADVPICNPDLFVEAVGFHRRGERIFGMVVTPWFLNLMITGVKDKPLAEASVGGAAAYRLPAGEVDCIVNSVPDLGRVDSCSLFSPMDAFENQEAARETAAHALAALFHPLPEDETPARRIDTPSRRALFTSGRA